MTPNKELFEQKFNELINKIWEIQLRISELREFEKQWKDLFENLKSRTGEDCQINIMNLGVLRNYRWDKYHILVSDLLSLHENELGNEESVIQQVIHFLEVLPSENYVDADYKVNFIESSGYKLTDDEQLQRLEEMRGKDAERTYTYKVDGLKKLFPKLGSDYKIGIDDVKHLLNQISSLAKDIKGMRHFFNHKYEDIVRKRYASTMEKFDLNYLEEVADKTFQVILNIGLVYKDSSYGKAEFSRTRDISDQIDLILFGSINNAISRFYEVANPEDYYWLARKTYFESDSILSIIVKSE